MQNAKYLKVNAQVRCWEDAEINGEQSEDGELVPFKNGNLWSPVIDLDSGYVLDWPLGIEARFHFKVCDMGDYYLLDADKNEIASILNNYVPDGLCHGDRGYGDYIIFNVDNEGGIESYKKDINADDWMDD